MFPASLSHLTTYNQASQCNIAIMSFTGDGDDDFAVYSSSVLDDVCDSNGDPSHSTAQADDPLSDDDSSSPSLQQAGILFPQSNLSVPLDFELRESTVPGASLGIWSRRKVNVGESFGPYEGEHTPCLQDPTQGWEVRTHISFAVTPQLESKARKLII